MTINSNQKQKTFDKEPIAIVGIGCRYPGGAKSPQEFWQFLLDKKDGFKTVPDERWSSERFQDSDDGVQGTAKPEEAAFLEEDQIRNFDAAFFNFSPREAECIDPQQRLLLQVAWEALEDANVKPSAWQKEAVGVYVGGFTIDNYLLQCSSENYLKIDQATATSSTLVMLSNRLSYFFDFNGPSLTIDTACSSSLVALNYACQDLWSGKANAAMVGGVNAMLYPALTVTMSKGGFLSPDSRSKAFDAGANGYARGEGAGVIVLKPLSKALADGDRIYAQVLSTGVNQDGRSAGIASPNGDAQSSLIKTVLQDNHISSDDVVMVEAHGTGTAVGDPTEITALGEALPPRIDGQTRFVSSVKGNIGHQEAGAGVAGIIKAALSLYHDVIPPQASLSEINPALDFKKGNFKVPRQPEKLIDQGQPKVACVNSFGYGGTNGHAILSSSSLEDSSGQGAPVRDHDLLLFSAKSEESLISKVEQIQQYVAEQEAVDLNNLSHTLACGRDELDFRFGLHVSEDDDLCGVLAQTAAELREGMQPVAALPAKPQNGPVFLYTGMGPQWWGMGRELYQENATFRQAVDAADQAFTKVAGWSIKEEMLDRDEDKSIMRHNKIAQPANFVLQHALTEMLAAWGVTPTAVIGHSVGEVSAALASGALSLEQAAETAFHRSRLQQLKAGQGRMLATGLDLETAQSIVEIYDGELSIGAINSPSSVALAGAESALRLVMEELDGQGVFNKLIFGEVAYHSYQMEDLKEELYTSLGGLEPKTPTLPLYSTTYGRRITEAEHNVDFWWANVRQPVLFQDALKHMIEDGYSDFVEVGPHPVLSGAIAQVFKAFSENKATVFSSLQRKKTEYVELLDLAYQLWSANQNIDWSQILTGSKLHLPTYPWDENRHWRESERSADFRVSGNLNAILGRRVSDAPETWENIFDSATLSFLKDHIIGERKVFPGAGYMEAFLAAVSDLYPSQGFGVSDVRFENLLVFPDQGSVQTRVVHNNGHLEFYAKDLSQDGKWQLYATASVIEQSRHLGKLDTDIIAGGAISLNHDEVYEKLATLGLNYQNDFKAIRQATIAKGHVYGEVNLSEKGWNDSRLLTHPALVDAGMQLLALCIEGKDTPPVPVKVGQISYAAQQGNNYPERLKVKGILQTDGNAIVQFADEEGTLWLELKRVEMQNIPANNRKKDTPNLLYVHQWNVAEQKESQPLTKLARTNDVEKLVSVWPEILDASTHDHVFLSTAQIEPDSAEATALNTFLVELSLKYPEDRAVIITRGAWHAEAADVSLPGQAPLWGIARSMRQEKTKTKIVCIDLPHDFDDWAQLPQLIANLPSFGEFALRSGELLQRNVQSCNEFDELVDPLVPNNDRFSSVLSAKKRGGLGSLHHKAHWRTFPGEDEIEVKIEYSALNFKDVLKILGRLTDQSLKGTFFQKSLGMEASAVVVRAGKNTDFRVGERIILGHKEGTFRTYITMRPEDAFILRWEDLPLKAEEFATLPIAFISSYYGLVKLADLNKGDRVLLHSASGGVGHAAIYLAQKIGAEIIATAGTKEKRDYIRSLGIEHVFDSRSLDFEQDVLNVTDNEGVDVVLNFLPGALLHANLRILKPFGRLVELGKADIGANKGLPLGEFERNLTFASVDIDHMLRFRRELFDRTASQLKDFFIKHGATSLPINMTDANDPVSAFKHMAEGNHIGKCMLDYMRPVAELRFPVGISKFKAGKTYVVSGGTQGFGLECAKWLVANGANNVALLSRSGRLSEDGKHFKASVENDGGVVSVLACDVSDRTQLKEMLKGLNPIAGVIHAAAVLRDQPMEQLDQDCFDVSFQAKANGAYNLHAVCDELGQELDHFIMFSSISGMIGNAGQANYAASNVYLDALVGYRRLMGKPAVSVAWGSLGEVGMVARDKTVENYLSSKGIQALPIQTVFEQLDRVISSGFGHVGCFDVDWDKWQKRMPDVNENDPVASLLHQSRDDNAQASLKAQLSGVQADAFEEIAIAFLTEKLSGVLNIKPEQVSADKEITLLGIDSLMSIEFQLAIESNLGAEGVSVSPNINQTIREMARELVSVLLADDDKKTDAGNEEELEIDLSTLSDEEVDRMLREIAE